MKPLYLDSGSDIDIRVIHDLAEAIHYSTSDHCVISWAAQEQAHAYFCQHGREATMDRTVDLWWETDKKA